MLAATAASIATVLGVKKYFEAKGELRQYEREQRTKEASYKKEDISASPDDDMKSGTRPEQKVDSKITPDADEQPSIGAAFGQFSKALSARIAKTLIDKANDINPTRPTGKPSADRGNECNMPK